MYKRQVHGTLPRPAGRLEGYILKDEAKKQVTVSSRPRPGAKTAVTLYETLAVRNGPVSYTHLILVFLSIPISPGGPAGRRKKIFSSNAKKYLTLFPDLFIILAVPFCEYGVHTPEGGSICGWI